MFAGAPPGDRVLPDRPDSKKHADPQANGELAGADDSQQVKTLQVGKFNHSTLLSIYDHFLAGSLGTQWRYLEVDTDTESWSTVVSKNRYSVPYIIYFWI